ncbi:MAG: hypothetical protein ACYDCO_23190 [Armatimonadota bacterium]
MARREPLNKGEKILLIGMIVLLAIGGFVAFWAYYSNIDPVVSIPTPTMLSPNARDLYLAAAKARVFSISVGAGTSLNTDEVAEWIDDGKIVKPERMQMLAGTPPPPKLADMQRLMKLNAPAIAKFRQGLAREYREPARRSRNDKSRYAELRQLARVLKADGDLHCAEGNWDAGVERYLDILRLGDDMQHGAPLIGMLVGTSVQAIGRQEVWPTLDHVSGTGARRAARRLAEIAARRMLYADILLEEKWATQAMMMEAFKGSNWRGFRSYMAYDGDRMDPLTSFRTLFCTKRQVMRNYTRYMNILIYNAAQLYPAVLTGPPQPRDPINARFISVYDDAWMRDYLARTQNDLLMVSFALRAYHADHGRYPASLKALVPAYLKSVPADAFAAKDTLGYKLTGTSYTLYSIGPDATDDGGTPSPDGQKTATGSDQFIMSGSSGDIVAGVNIK